MAKIKAFKGVRPNVNFVEEIVSKPYDVVNYEEAKKEAKNPNSFMHIVRSEVDLNGVDIYSPDVYTKAKENLDKLVKKDLLKEDSKESLYLYSQTMSGRTQHGLVVASAVEDYVNNIIKKHEHTRQQKEDDRYNHVKTTQANTGPVFLTYKDSNIVDATVAEVSKTTPTYNFTRDEITHKFWVIADQSIIKSLTEEFSKIDSLYVADGHHRSASAARVATDFAKESSSHTGNEEYNYFLSVLFPASQLYIMAYNRLVNIDFDREKLFNNLASNFTIKEVSYDTPKQKGEFLAYTDGKWYSLISKAELTTNKGIVEKIDVAILQNYVLDKEFGIKDPRTDNRIDFVGGIRGIKPLMKAIDAKTHTIAFSLYPTSIDELMAVSDAGLVMPPKSTWFEPKLLSGLITHKLF